MSGALDNTSDNRTAASFQVVNYGADGGAKLGLSGNDLSDIGIEPGDIDGFAGVLLLDVERHRDVVTVLC